MLKRVAESLTRVISPVSRILNDISCAVLTFVMLMVTADVFMRRIFNSPIEGAHDLSILSFSIVVFLPMAWAGLMNRHVDLNILVNRLPKIPRTVIESLMMLLTTGMLGVTCWRLLAHGLRLQSQGAKTMILGISTPPFVYLATFGMMMITLVFFIKFLLTLNNFGEESQ